MRITIASRLFLALTLVSLVVLGLSAVITRWNFENSFLTYIEDQESDAVDAAIATLAEKYRFDPGWTELRTNPRRWDELWRPERGGGPRGRPPPREKRNGGPHPPPPDPLAIGRRITLLDGDGEWLVGRQLDEDTTRKLPIVVDDNTVGFVAISPPKEFTNPADLRFAREQERSIYLAAGVALLLAAAISAFIARQLTRPIRALEDGARSIAAGDLGTRIDSDRNDELGDLARDFNRLAETLEENQASRKRWVADIAHELRTPLAILRGEVDAVADGVRQFDASTQASLRAEVERLSRLIDDLHDLSVHDDGSPSYRYEAVDIGNLLGNILDAAENRFQDAEIRLQVLLANGLYVQADAGRLEQLFTNLLENTLRYTDRPGTLHVSCRQDYASVDIAFSDSTPGVPPGSIERLFDRLYRVDPSRGRELGGSGLGLAICKAIVDAHDGKICAAHSEAGGLTIRIQLPLSETNGDTV